MRTIAKAALGTTTAVTLLCTAVPSAQAGDDTVPSPAHFGTGDGWGPWSPEPAPPSTLRACGTTITITAVVNHEESRSRTDKSGNTYVQNRGAFINRLDAADGRSATVDVSGQTAPGGWVFYKNGDFLLDSLGANLIYPPSFIKGIVKGLPRNYVSQGPLTFYVTKSGKQTMLRYPQSAVSLCDLLNGKKQPAGDKAQGGYTDWGPLTPAPGSPFTIKATHTRVTFPVNQAMQKTRTDKLGNTYLYASGETKMQLTQGSRRSRLVDISGATAPGGHVIFKDGRFLFDGLGDNVFFNASGTPGLFKGLPNRFVSRGTLSAVQHPDGSVTMLRYPPQRYVVSFETLLDGKSHWPFTDH